MGFVGASVNYVGSRPFEFTSAPAPGQPVSPRIEFPSFTQLNLRAGAQHDSWRMNLYVNNVADRRGVVGINNQPALGLTGGYYATVIQPRTIGLNVVKTF
jgi:outer membrane receptor protein involved in Fe transport